MLAVYVAIGGAFGSVARYLMMSGLTPIFGREFPYSTLIVNVLGSFLLGVTVGVIAVFLPPRDREIHALIAVGVLGGFTTFSTFAMDAYLLIEKGEWLNAIAYAGGSVIMGIAAFFLGMWVLRQIA